MASHYIIFEKKDSAGPPYSDTGLPQPTQILWLKPALLSARFNGFAIFANISPFEVVVRVRD